MFHIAHLRPFEPNDEAMFPGRDAQVFYDFGLDTEEEFEVDEIIAHHWEGQTIEFYVRFKDRDIFWEAYKNCKDGDIFWEAYENCKDLAALNRYLELHGVANWRRLPKNEHPTGAPSRRH